MAHKYIPCQVSAENEKRQTFLTLCRPLLFHSCPSFSLSHEIPEYSRGLIFGRQRKLSYLFRTTHNEFEFVPIEIIHIFFRKCVGMNNKAAAPVQFYISIYFALVDFYYLLHGN